MMLRSPGPSGIHPEWMNPPPHPPHPLPLDEEDYLEMDRIMARTMVGSDPRAMDEYVAEHATRREQLRAEHATRLEQLRASRPLPPFIRCARKHIGDACAICLEPFKKAHAQYKCAHCFHQKCMLDHVTATETTTCPLCRASLE